MKFKFLIIGTLFIFCCSCTEMLDLNPEKSLVFSNAITSELELESAIRSVASSAKSQLFTGYNYVYVKGELADTTIEYEYRNLRNLSPKPVKMLWWEGLYQLIAGANYVLSYVDGVDINQERRDFYKGQALFYKSIAYFTLIRLFGDCVLVKEQPFLEYFPKTTWPKVADYAIELAEEAVRLLPEFSGITDSKGQAALYKSVPSKGAANALLAHLCAWKAGGKYFVLPEDRDYDEAELWEKAEKACTDIIKSGEYVLASNPEEVCTSVLVGGSKEGIYEMEYRAFWSEQSTDGTPADWHGMCYQNWSKPVSDGGGLGVIWNAKFNIFAETVKELYPLVKDEHKNIIKHDLRREAYFYKLDSLSHDTLRKMTKGYAYPWKLRNIRLTTTGGGQAGYFEHFDNNYIYFRLGEIYLLRAECRARLGGEYRQGAIDDLNVIRKRAGIPGYDVLEDNGNLRYTIFKEREKELFMEGYRYYDVIRNGYHRSELGTGFKEAADQDFIDGAFFYALDSYSIGDNTLVTQNVYWMKRM